MANLKIEGAVKIPLGLASAVLMGCAALCGGCNSLSGEAYVARQDKAMNEEAPAAAGDRAARARAANTFPAAPGSAGYRIGPQDVLDVTVFKVPDLSKTVQVAEEGTINLPLIGQASAAGMTTAQVERDLEAKWGARYLKSPQVTVVVKEYNSQRVTVEGAVKRPGVFALHGHDTLMQTIATAGGVDRDAASSEVTVFRAIDGGRSAMRFDMDDIRSGRAEDVQINAGDVVVMGESAAKSAFQVFTKLAPVAEFASTAALVH